MMRPWAVAASLFAGSFLLRAYRLGVPRSLVFDEKYYASDALDLLQAGVESGRPDHPPLGKWLIAAGIQLFGFTPVGWRFAAVVAGSALVVVTYLIARQLNGREGLGVLAALLVALDGIAFTTSRVAMLDVFFAFFVTVGAGLGLLAVKRGNASAGKTAAAAAALGCALAVKWSALPIIAVVLAMFLVARQRAIRPIVTTVAHFAFLPAAIYLGVHVPWFVNFDDTRSASRVCGAEVRCAPSLPTRVDAWVGQQLDVLDDHRGHRPTSAQARPGWSWVTFPEPTVFFRKYCTPAMAGVPDDADDGACPKGATGPTKAKIANTGSPILWLAAGVAAPILLWRGIRRRDPLALFLLMVGAALWVPWLLTPRHVYSFYAAPLVPVLSWWVVIVLGELDRSGRFDRLGRLIGPGIAVAASLAFAWFYPTLVGWPLDPGDVRFMIPFRT